MKEKIINYIEQLEAKSLQVDDYFKQRNELYISNQEKDKEIERLHSIIKEVREYVENNGHYDFYNLDVAVDGEKLLEILDKENI